MKTADILSMNAGFVLFVLAKTKMVMHTLRHDSAILVALISNISNLCTLSMTAGSINNVVNRESSGTIRVDLVRVLWKD